MISEISSTDFSVLFIARTPYPVRRSWTSGQSVLAFKSPISRLGLTGDKLLGHDATVDLQHLAVDEAALVGAEQFDEGGDVAGFTEAAGRVFSQ